MKMRTILLSSYQELDNGVTEAVPIDLLEEWVIQRNVSTEDFKHELLAALHEGDLMMTSPGMIGMTQAGTRHYAAALQLS